MHSDPARFGIDILGPPRTIYYDRPDVPWKDASRSLEAMKEAHQRQALRALRLATRLEAGYLHGRLGEVASGGPLAAHAEAYRINAVWLSDLGDQVAALAKATTSQGEP